LPAKIIEPTNIAIPISKILSICSSLGDDDLVFKISSKKVEIKTSFGEYNIMGQSSEEFPDKVKVDEKEGVSFDSNKIEELIDYTIDSTSTDDLKPSLQGVLFDINEAKTTLVSTDGHRLSKIEEPQNNPISKKIIIPTKFLKLTQSFLLKNQKIEVLIGENHAQVFFEGAKISTRLIKDSYPDYEKVIPKNNDTEITIETKKLINSLKRVSVFSNKKTKQATLIINNNEIFITAEDTETAASAKEKISCTQNNDKKITIAFNGDYLKEILEKTKTEETKILLKDELSAALIVPKEEPMSNKISLLMPIRLN